jgi:hypothetical protein
MLLKNIANERSFLFDIFIIVGGKSKITIGSIAELESGK